MEGREEGRKWMLIIERKWRILAYLLLYHLHLPRSHFPFPRFSVNPVPPPLPDRSRAVSFVHYSDSNFLFHFKNSALKKLNDAVVLSVRVRPSVPLTELRGTPGEIPVLQIVPEHHGSRSWEGSTNNCFYTDMSKRRMRGCVILRACYLWPRGRVHAT